MGALDARPTQTPRAIGPSGTRPLPNHPFTMKCPRCQYELKPDSFSSEVVCTNCEFSAGPLDSSQADPAQLIAARDWDALIGDADHPGLLTDLRFIEAQCKWGREQVLLDHYNRALDAAPKFSGEEEEPEPGETEEEDKTIITRPQAERLRAFEGFVSSHDRLLTEIPQDTVPFAFNYSEDGPVAAAAKILLPTHEGRWLKRSGSPLKLRSFNWASISGDGRRAILTTEGDADFRVWDLERRVCAHSVNASRILNARANIGNDERGAIFISDGNDLSWTSARLASISNNGGYAILVTDDAETHDTLWVWDPEKRVCLYTLKAGLIYGGCASITNDGRRAILGNRDGTLDVWDLEHGARLHALEGHPNFLNCVGISPDGRRALSGGFDATVRVWDLERGNCLLTLEGHKGGVNCVGVSPDGCRALSGSSDKTVRAWDLESGKSLLTLEGHEDCVNCAGFSPDGRQAVTASDDNTLRVWDLNAGACWAVCHINGSPGFVGFVASSDRIVCGTKDGQMLFLTPVNFPP